MDKLASPQRIVSQLSVSTPFSVLSLSSASGRIWNLCSDRATWPLDIYHRSLRLPYQPPPSMVTSGAGLHGEGRPLRPPPPARRPLPVLPGQAFKVSVLRLKN